MTVPTVLGVSQETGSPAWGTSFTPTFSSFSAGQLLVIVGACSDTMTSVTNGTGWTSRGSVAAPYGLFVYTKTAAGSSDTIPTFNLNSFSRYSWTTFHVAVGDFDTTTPIDAFTSAGGTSDNPPAPSTTPTATRDHLWLTAFAHGGNGTPGQTIGAPSGHTLVGAGHSMDYLAHAVARKSYTSAGATGTATYSFAPGNAWNAISFLLRPGAGGTPQSITLTPVDLTVSPVDLTLTPGGVSITLTPVTATVTPVTVVLTVAGAAQSISLTPITLTVSPVDITPVAPELATDIETNEIWVQEFGKPATRFRAAVVGAQGTAMLLELRSGVVYEVAAKATRTNGASRWTAEWTSFVA